MAVIYAIYTCMSEGYNVTYGQKYILYTLSRIRKIAPNSKMA